MNLHILENGVLFHTFKKKSFATYNISYKYMIVYKSDIYYLFPKIVVKLRKSWKVRVSFKTDYNYKNYSIYINGTFHFHH